MIQYLLNLTAIWVFSLLIFDVLFSRDSYQTYSRAYLLITCMAGIFFPLIKWGENGKVHIPIVADQVKSVVSIKQNVVTAIAPDHDAHKLHWLLLFYISGVIITLLILIIDVVKLIAYYRRGNRSKMDKWTVVETGRNHTPFSFFRILFVSSSHQYSGDEWAMILAHEGRHMKLLHFIDLLVLQIVKTIFWFHPIIYLYHRRLLLVHEYQADAVAKDNPGEYGRFLVMQAMLKSAPLLTHSFNRSPIKKRIIMLTHKSSGIARAKQLLSLPILMVCLLFFSNISFSQNKKDGNMIRTFGVDATTQDSHITYAQALGNPVLSCNEPNCEVTGFTISFVPKGGEMEGMYNIIGASVNGTALEKIKQFKNAIVSNTRVFIEDIHVKKNGREMKLPQGIAFRMYDK